VQLTKDSEAEYEIVLNNIEGHGEVALHIQPGTAVDSAGNYAPEYVGEYALTVHTETGLSAIGGYGYILLIVLIGLFGIVVMLHPVRQER
ncbi:MAG: hypothetical protein ACP5UA_13725, partial [Candidatus Hydrogenedens sp.]